MSEQPPAGILATRGHNIGNECNSAAAADRVSKQSQMNDHEPAQLILTVDYSDAALTVLLLVEECNVFEIGAYYMIQAWVQIPSLSTRLRTV